MNCFCFFVLIGHELAFVPIFLYFICGTPTTAWLDKWCHVWTGKPRAAKAEHAHLTLCHQAGSLVVILKLLSLSFSSSLTIWPQYIVLALSLATHFVQGLSYLSKPAQVASSDTVPSPTAQIGQVAHASGTWQVPRPALCWRPGVNGLWGPCCFLRIPSAWPVVETEVFEGVRSRAWVLWGPTVGRRCNRKVRKFFIEGVTLKLRRASSMFTGGDGGTLCQEVESVTRHGVEELRAVWRGRRASGGVEAWGVCRGKQGWPGRLETFCLWWSLGSEQAVLCVFSPLVSGGTLGQHLDVEGESRLCVETARCQAQHHRFIAVLQLSRF